MGIWHRVITVLSTLLVVLGFAGTVACARTTTPVEVVTEIESNPPAAKS